MIAKVLISIAFYLVLLVSLIASQLSLILILKTNGASSVKTEWLLAVFFIISTPEIAFILKSIWKAYFISKDKFHRWPSSELMFVIVLLPIVEGVTIVYLVIYVFPKITSYLLPSVLMLFLLPEMITFHMGGDHDRCCKIALKFTCSLVLMGFVAAVIVFHTFKGLLSLPETFLTFILTFGLGIPNFTPMMRYTQRIPSPKKHSISVLSGVLKLSSVAITFLVISVYERKMYLLDLFKEIGHALTSNLENHGTLVVYVVINFVFTLISQMINNINYQTKNKIVPVIIACSSQLITVFICILAFFVEMPSFKINFSHVDGEPSTDHAGIYLVSCVSIVIPLFFVLISRILSKSADECLFNFKQNSRAPNSVFLVQSLCMNNRLLHETLTPDKNYNVNSQRTKTKVYICTTMYQEAHFEMERLLVSLKKILFSQIFINENIFLESHIFLDNGVLNNDLTDFGKQLLELVDEIFAFPDDAGLLIYTPYGIQLAWSTQGIPSLFIHFKDNTKVKAKKRWSQIMYMKYILEFRSHISYTSSYSKQQFRNDFFVKHQQNGIQRHAKSLPNILLEYSENVNAIGEDNDSIIYFKQSDQEGEKRENGDVTFEMLNELNVNTLSIPTEMHSMKKTYSISSITGSVDTFLVPESKDEYILMTDADMLFGESEVLNIINTCQKNEKLGGVCGRTFPVGQKIHPIVWLQMFDYAKDFWMVKSTQNMIGSVMCCPGCFSLFRFDALRDVFQTYSEPTSSIEDIFTKDNGEDRWMCTLMMLKGWRLQYASGAYNSTFCPEDTEEFMKQRRRWLLSDFANAYVVFRNLGNLMHQNGRFTLFNTFCLFQLFLMMFLYPGSTVIFLSLGLEIISGLPFVACTVVLSLVIVGYCCLLVADVATHVQVLVTKILTIILGLFTITVFVMASIYIAENFLEDYENSLWTFAENVMLISLAATYIMAACLHPKESYILLCGIAYLYYLPFLNILLPCYAICNIVDQSWGTRDNQIANFKNVFRLPKMYFGKRRKSSSALTESRSMASLSASSLRLDEHDQDELSFWENTVKTLIGVEAAQGLKPEERSSGLRKLRKRAVVGFLAVNAIWIALFCLGFYLFVFFVKEKDLFSVIVLGFLGLTPLTQVVGMVLFKLKNFWEMMNRLII